MNHLFVHCFRLGLPVFMLLGHVADAYAQKKVDAGDKRKIQYAIEKALDGHRSLVEFVAAEGDAQMIEEGVQNRVDDYYLNKEVKVDVDYDANSKGQNVQATNIYNYLTELHTYFKPSKEFDFVQVTSEWDGRVYEGDPHPWVRVNFRQHFLGKDKNKKTFSPVNKVAEMQLRKAGDQWSAKISGIYFVEKLAGKPQPKEIRIAGEATAGESDNQAVLDESYFMARLDQGRISLQNRKYARAYFYLSEAAEARSQETAAQTLLTELKNKLRGENALWQEYLSNELSKEGRLYQQRKDYVTAQRYYQHAFFINDKNLDARAKAEMLLQYVNNYKALDRLYRNGHYEDAVAGFKSSIASDEGNSYLMLGLARCYVKTGNDSLANVYFQRAIESDADNVQIYKWQAEFLKENRRYEEAERAFLNFINHAEVNDPDLAYINSLRTSVKGIALFNSGKKGEALDSLTKAIKYYESNSEAYCYISRYYAEDKRDYAEAEKYVNLAIVHDTNYVPAYVQKADLMTRKTALLGLPSTHSSAAANRLEAIRLLTKAISKDRRNNEAYFNRGKLYLELGGFDDLVAATEDFTKAADDTLNNKYRYWSIWYRGKCRYALGGEELRKAGDDFRKSAENYGSTKAFCVDYGFLLLKLGDPQSAVGWFKKVNSPEAQYGEILSNMKLDRNSVNGDKDRLERAFASGVLKRERVTKDFSDIGLSDMLREEPVKSLIKKLN